MPDRRAFLGITGGILASAGKNILRADAPNDAPPAKLLPTVTFGKTKISRMIMGGNPIGGWSHATPKLDEIMRQWCTVDRVRDMMLHAEAEGIITFQSSYTPVMRDALNGARELGSKVEWLCLAHADDPWNEIMALKPIGIAHHGNRTDYAFHGGYEQKVHDFVKKIKDAGIFAGVSSHCPQIIAKIEDLGWENDYYMTCLYYVTRTPEELKKAYGDTLVQGEEPFLAGDPARMCEKIRATKKPCLAFKLLAAGRNCRTKQMMENAIQFAYTHIKPIDACIVGMFPMIRDEIREDAEFARRFAKA